MRVFECKVFGTDIAVDAAEEPEGRGRRKQKSSPRSVGRPSRRRCPLRLSLTVSQHSSRQEIHGTERRPGFSGGTNALKSGILSPRVCSVPAQVFRAERRG